MNTRHTLSQGPVNAQRVLVTRAPSHNDEWSRMDRAYYGSQWDHGGKSLFKMPKGLDTPSPNVVRYQSRGTKVERIK